MNLLSLILIGVGLLIDKPCSRCCNVGKIDKVIRIIIGLAIGAAGDYFKSWWRLIGIVPIFTALISWCPLYFTLGIKTC